MRQLPSEWYIYILKYMLEKKLQVLLEQQHLNDRHEKVIFSRVSCLAGGNTEDESVLFFSKQKKGIIGAGAFCSLGLHCCM